MFLTTNPTLKVLKQMLFEENNYLTTNDQRVIKKMGFQKRELTTFKRIGKH